MIGHSKSLGVGRHLARWLCRVPVRLAAVWLLTASLVAGGASAQVLATAPAGGSDPEVIVFDAATLEPRWSVHPFPSGGGGARAALADVDGDLVPDLLVGAGEGEAAVKIYDGQTGGFVPGFTAFEGADAGLHIAAGDFGSPGPGKDVVTGSGPGSSPEVKVFDAAGVELVGWVPFEPSFTGGVRVATGDADGDGSDDVVTGAGPGSSPVVKAFSGLTQEELWSVEAFDSADTTGVYVTTVGPPEGDLGGIESFFDVVAGSGASPTVKILRGDTGQLRASFQPFGPAYGGGIRLGGGAVARGGVAGVVVTADDGTTKIFEIRPGVAEPRVLEVATFLPYVSPGGVRVGLPAVAPEILLVNDGRAQGDEGPYVLALDSRGVTYQIWHVPNLLEPPADALDRFTRIVWLTGDADGGSVGPTSASEAALTSWLADGGCLFLSSAEYFSDHPGLNSFLVDVLGVAGGQPDLGAIDALGAGGPFTPLGPYLLDHPFPDRSDHVQPTPSAVAAFTDGEGEGLSVFRATAQSRTAFLSFPLAAVFDTTDRADVLEAFFASCPDQRNEIFSDGFESGDSSAWSAMAGD